MTNKFNISKNMLLMAVAFALIASFMNPSPVIAEDGIETLSSSRFTLVEMNSSGTMKNISGHSTLKAAKSAMDSHKGINLMVRDSKSLSPNKLVAQKGGGSAQAYPYRQGVVSATGSGPNMLAYIYQSPSMSGDRTYVSAHYQMKYIDTVENSKGQLLARVNISGFEGYIDMTKVDLIPALVLERGITWRLGGNEKYYDSPEAPVDMVIKPDVYTVRYNGDYKVHEMDFSYYRGYPKHNGTIYSIGVAPSWLKPGTYYSPDGIEFYTDVRQTNRVKDDKGRPGRNINYYQFLPLRSKSNITGTELDKYLAAQGYTDSVYAGLGNVFTKNGDEYGMNPLLVYSMANLESAFGTSHFAKDRYNIFGWGAADSSPGDANAYDGINEVVDKHMGHNLRGYTSLNDWRFFGYSVGNKGSGFNTSYASDPYWGMKIASLAYRVDRAYGFKDLEAYQLGQLDDKTAVNVRASASMNSAVLYQTKNNMVDQFVTLNKKSGDFYETYSAYPIVNGKIVPYEDSTQNVKIDLSKNLAYVHNTTVKPIDKIFNKGGTVIPKPPVDEYSIKYKVNADVGLRVRSQANTSSKILGVLNYNSTVYGKKAVNGWVEIMYNSQKGYISAEYLDNTETKSYLLGDGNRDGVIDMQDYYKVGFHILGKETMNKETIKAYDTNKDGIIDMQDYYAISFHILGSKKVTETQRSD